MINFDTPNQIHQNILQLIDSIDMFTIKNFEDLKVNKLNEKLDFYKTNLYQMKP